MTEEIFGPVLPVLTVNSCDEAISFVNSKSFFGQQKRWFSRGFGGILCKKGGVEQGRVGQVRVGSDGCFSQVVNLLQWLGSQVGGCLDVHCTQKKLAAAVIGTTSFFAFQLSPKIGLFMAFNSPS